MLLQRIEQTKFSYMRMMSAFHVSKALEEAGYSNVKLYFGSWSDWISYEENAVETVDE